MARTNAIVPRGWLALGAGLALGLASPAAASPVGCPVVSNLAICEVEVGASYLRVDASTVQGSGDILVFDWFLDGVAHLYYEALRLADLPGLDGISTVLETATVDPATGVIQMRVRDLAATLRLTATFQLGNVANGSTVDEVLTLESLAGSHSTRLYAITDFDLNGGSVDGSILASGDGSLITQVDGSTQATISTLGGPPDAFTVAPCCGLDDIASGNFYFDLGGNTTVAGPADFQSGLSWDVALSSGQSFTVQLRKRITVPEPSHALGAAAALLAGLAFARRRTR